VRSESAAGCPGGARLDELGSLLSAWLLCGPWWPLLLGRSNCGGLDNQFVIARGHRALTFAMSVTGTTKLVRPDPLIKESSETGGYSDV
jgi:hypothetical protein